MPWWRSWRLFCVWQTLWTAAISRKSGAALSALGIM
ncbi:hypothetical protein EVA_11441 [gut metagenome]|uniref:Uncharacterized protein n=1 Tax=gut metagenome TaxID=749906 RepID=J9CK27_9ZZZZ